MVRKIWKRIAQVIREEWNFYKLRVDKRTVKLAR